MSASGTMPATIAWTRSPRVSGNQVVPDFRVTGSPAPARYELLRAEGGAWTWVTAAGAQLQVIIPDREYRFSVEAGTASSGFYRVRGI